MEENKTILGILSSTIGGYLSVRTDDFKKNVVTNLFSGIIEEESPSDNWKTLLLTIVKNLRGNLDA